MVRSWGTFALALAVVLATAPLARVIAQAPAEPVFGGTNGVANGDSLPAGFLQVGGTRFFLATTSAHGRELWRSDATAGDATLLKDITPGAASTSFNWFMPVGDLLFFGIGVDLWKSDGTPAGTVLVKHLCTPTLETLCVQISVPAAVGDVLFFTGTDEAGDVEPWRSDGTAAGTVRVKDVQPGVDLGGPIATTVVDGVVYFFEDAGRELWKSDGTDAGTTLVTTLAGPFNFDMTARAVNGTLLFTHDDGVNGAELWKSNGTPAGTMLVKDIRAGSGGSTPTELVSFEDTLYFLADDGINGTELWSSDGTGMGTALVRDIRAGAISSQPSALIEAGGKLYLAADDGVAGRELWVSDGTGLGTTLVLDINPGPAPAIATGGLLADVNGAVVFAADDGSSGKELWRSDGTPGGTMQVMDIRPGPPSSIGALEAAHGSPLLFGANDGTVGDELWATDGTPGGTFLVRDILGQPTYGDGGSPFNDLGPVAADLNGLLIFQNAPDTFGTTDGTPGGTNLVTFGSLTINTPFVPIGATAYFGALNSGTGGDGIYKTDGTMGGTFTINAGTSGDAIGELASAGSFAYYTRQIGAYIPFGPFSSQLWRTNGFVSGTIMLKDPGNGGYCNGLTNAGGTLFFEVIDASGSSLWKTNGTVAGTVLLHTFSENDDSTGRVRAMVAVGTSVYFLRAEGDRWTLWKSNGTAAGTVPVKDVAYHTLFIYNRAVELTNVNGTLFFVAGDITTHRQMLWKSDGTTAGTVVVTDIAPNTPEPTLRELTNVNGTLFFFGQDDVAGLEPWKSDGTAMGTVRIKDIRPGPDTPFESFYSVYRRAAGGRLYFTADEGDTGFELWQTDGTEAGTVRIDIHPGPDGSNPNELVVVGTTLYFVALGTDFEGIWRIRNATTCGDGDVDGSEDCDDGDTDNGDGCTVACTASACGDGFTAGAEQCDDGNSIDTDACPSTCVTAACGDGELYASFEACDDGNPANGDGCDANCTPTSCGNGIATAGEECDSGSANGRSACALNCVLCGNGATGPGEECDDANAVDTDGCTNRCTSCGNGTTTGSEECDDGNLTNNDGCDANCRATGCGNGVAIAGEQCDDGNRLGGDCCGATCQLDAPGVACAADGNDCSSDVCNGAGTCTHTPAAGPCDDGVFCNGADTCSSGVCTQHGGNPCTSGSECANVCDENAESCNAVYGTACSADSNPCSADQCNGLGACIHPPQGGSCDDALFCTGTDSCDFGTCVHSGDPCTVGGGCTSACNEAADSCNATAGTPCTSDSDVCLHGSCDGVGACTASETPLANCTEAEKTGLQLSQIPAGKLLFKWKGGPSFSPEQLGDPSNADGYTLCVYDAAGLLGRAEVAPGGTCDGRPCWKVKGSTYKFKDKLGTNAGITGIVLKSTSTSKLKVKGKGGTLFNPMLPLDGPVTAQLMRSDGSLCLGGSYDGAQISINDANHFKAKSP